MKNIIKRYIGIVGFIIGLILISLSAYYKYYIGNSHYHESLAWIGFTLWALTSTISMELNKPKPKIWFIYFISITSIILFTCIVFIKQ